MVKQKSADYKKKARAGWNGRKAAKADKGPLRQEGKREALKEASEYGTTKRT